MRFDNLFSLRAVLSVICQNPVILKIKPIWPKYNTTYYTKYMFNRNIFFSPSLGKKDSPVDGSFKISQSGEISD